MEPEPTKYQAIGLSAIKQGDPNNPRASKSRNETVNEAQTETDSILIGLRKTENESLPNDQTQTVTLDPVSQSRMS